MKVLIPVAGAGTTLRPLTYTQPKALIPVAGKPIITFIVDKLIAEGCDDFVFIVGYLGEKIENFVSDTYPSLKKSFVYQKERLGIGHAVWTAKEACKDSEEVLIVLGDLIIDLDLHKIIKEPQSFLGFLKVSRPSAFGIIELDDDGNVIKLIEKPVIPKSNIALAGIYKIREVDLLFKSLDYLIANEIKTHNEFQLTDAMMMLVESGVELKTIEVTNWFDCGRKDILLKTNAILLGRSGFATKILPSYDNSIIIQPVSIGENCIIKNSIVGPNVAIGYNSKISNSILKDSILGNYTSIKDAVLKDSILGNDTAIKGFITSLNIGDNTEIDFS